MSFVRRFSNFLISALFALALSLAAPGANAQSTVTVTGHLTQVSGIALPGGTGGNAYKVCLSLRTGDNQVVTNARIVGGGGALILASNGNANCFIPDNSGAYSFTSVPNDLIETLGTVGGTQYLVFFQKGTSFITGSNYVFNLADGVENLDVKLPNTIVPIVPAPTGDSIYIRRDGANGPVTGALSWNSLQTFVAGIVSQGAINAGTNAISGGAISGSSVTASSQFVGSGSLSAPAYSYTGELGSGWFLQQAGIQGFARQGNYVTQVNNARWTWASGYSLAFSSGAPNAVSGDVGISRGGVGILDVGNGNAGDSSGTVQAAGAIVGNINGVLTVDGTKYTTIDAAYTDCPSTGCVIRIKAGTLACPTTTITKPIILEGAGSGGLADVSTFSTYSSPTILTNGSTTATCINVGLPVSNSLSGVTIRNLSIQGNKNVTSVSTGHGIQLTGGANTTAMRDIYIENVLVRDAKQCGLSIFENVFLVHVSHSQFIRNATNGICVGNSGTGIPSQISLESVTSDLNSADALNISGSNTQDISAWRSTFADSTNGVNVVVGSVNATFNCTFCNFEKNTNAGVLIKDGYGHFLGWSHFPADGVQLFGVNVDPPAGANFVNNQITLAGNNFGSNLTKDVQFSANLHVGMVYPQATNQSAYTFLDSSNTAMVLDAANGQLQVAGLAMAPKVSGSTALGASGNRWNGVFTIGLNDSGSGSVVKRLKASNGTAVVAGDFVLSAGWGTTATVTNVIGTDQAWQIQVNSSGTGQASSPTITFTFHDGTWTNSPIAISKMTGGSGSITQTLDSATATVWTMTFSGTPGAGLNYVISGQVMGR